MSKVDQAPRGFENAQEHAQKYEEVADDYSSREQAQAAADLVRVVSERHKTIDVAVAKRAKALLKEMVTSGGDLDLEVVRAVLAEAEAQYAAAEDEITQKDVMPDNVRARLVRDDETTFVRTEPKLRGENVAPQETRAQRDTAMWEGWRAHLRSLDVVSDDGMDVDLAAAQKLGLSAEQAKHIAALQRDEYLRGPGHGKEIRARVVTEDLWKREGVSLERQRLQQQRDAAGLARDALAQKLWGAQVHERAKIQQQLQDADVYLARIEDDMRKTG